VYGFYRLFLSAWVAWGCGWGNTAAAGLYKWVDENGQVHFSQTRPQQQAVSVTFVQVEGAGGIKPRENDGEIYCGETRVPFDADDEPLIQLANLRGNIEHYRQRKTQHDRELGSELQRD